jgi:hypothetical protein
MGEELTSESVRERLVDYITKERRGLLRFYREEDFDQVLAEPIRNGVVMANGLMNSKSPCKKETALSLCLLALFDVVMLIGMSSLV